MTESCSHILYHVILRQCSLEQYKERSLRHINLGALFVASFFEQSDSETPTPHFHCLVRLPFCKKTYEDKYRAKYEERNLQVIKQIKPITLDPTHLENTLLYIAKDGHLVQDDGSIDWNQYMRRRQVPVKKDTKTKPSFNEFLVQEFQRELDSHPELYKVCSYTYEYQLFLIEASVLRWLKKYFTGKYKDFDEIILIKKYHFLNSMFSLGGLDVVELALNKLNR